MREQLIDAEWVRDRLSQTGKTQRELASAIGLDPSAVSRLLDGRRHLRADEIPNILAFFESSESSASAKSGVPAKPSARSREPKAEPQASTIWPTLRKRPRPGPKVRDRSTEPIAVYGPLHPAGGGYYDLEDNVTEYCARPPQLVGVAGAFALVIPDKALEPRYCLDEIIYVHPHKTPIVGSWVVVRWGVRADRVVIGIIITADDRSVEIRTFDKGPHSFKRTEIGQIGRIVVSATEW